MGLFDALFESADATIEAIEAVADRLVEVSQGAQEEAGVDLVERVGGAGLGGGEGGGGCRALAVVRADDALAPHGAVRVRELDALLEGQAAISKEDVALVIASGDDAASRLVRRRVRQADLVQVATGVVGARRLLVDDVVALDDAHALADAAHRLRECGSDRVALGAAVTDVAFVRRDRGVVADADQSGDVVHVDEQDRSDCDGGQDAQAVEDLLEHEDSCGAWTLPGYEGSKGGEPPRIPGCPGRGGCHRLIIMIDALE